MFILSIKEKIGYNELYYFFIFGGAQSMKLILILGVIVTFLTAIFTSSYDSKPGEEAEK